MSWVQIKWMFLKMLFLGLYLDHLGGQQSWRQVGRMSHAPPKGLQLPIESSCTRAAHPETFPARHQLKRGSLKAQILHSVVSINWFFFQFRTTQTLSQYFRVCSLCLALSVNLLQTVIHDFQDNLVRQVQPLFLQERVKSDILLVSRSEAQGDLGSELK